MVGDKMVITLYKTPHNFTIEVGIGTVNLQVKRNPNNNYCYNITGVNQQGEMTLISDVTFYESDIVNQIQYACERCWGSFEKSIKEQIFAWLSTKHSQVF